MEDLKIAIDRDDRASLKKALKKYNALKDIEIEEKSLLSYAISKNISFDNFTLLVENGADIEAKTNEGVNLLDDAIAANRLDLVKYLVENFDFDINKPTRRSGFTPLMLAASFSLFEIVDYLLEKGADMMIRDTFNLNVFDYTRKLGQMDMKKYLEQRLSQMEQK